MKIVEITALDNGAHRNQTFHGELPKGWAFVTVGTDILENFPFGSFEVEMVEGVPYMKADTWTPGIMPEPESEPEAPKPEPTTAEILNAMLGVKE